MANVGNGAPHAAWPLDGEGAFRLNLVGNLIGTDPTGTAPRGNSVGVYLDEAKETVIGGTTPAERNVISGNRSYGVRTSDWTGGGITGGNRLIGNSIGVDITGTAALAMAPSRGRKYSGYRQHGAVHHRRQCHQRERQQHLRVG
ncbi:MAG: hypothetical protein U0232_20820 [Thermomicrobiales bacterium]